MQCLNWQKTKLELITDPNMYIFFQKGDEGRISYISNKYSKANNKYLKSHHPKQESKHIAFLDANNFYGYAESKPLPTDRFKWIDPKEYDLNKYTNNGLKGCIIEVHLEYLKRIK